MNIGNDTALGNSPNVVLKSSFAATSPKTLSGSELRTAMQQHFRRNGTLKTLKTHIRGMLLTELIHQQKRLHKMATQQRAAFDREGLITLEAFEKLRRGEPYDTAVGQSSKEHDDSLLLPATSFTSWVGCMADALIEEHLRATRRNMTLSIFSTEVEVPPLSDTGSPSDERERLEQLLFMPNFATKNDESLSNDGPASVSVLQRLVSEHLIHPEAQPRAHRSDCGTQTETDPAVSSAWNGSTPPLEYRLAAVDAKYALAFSRLGRSNDTLFFTRAEVERRLNSYKNDIHEQLRGEYQQKSKIFEENKLREVKEALEAQYQLIIQNKNEELREVERSLLVKYEQERQRLKLSREDVERQRLEVERRQKEMRETVNSYERQIDAQEATQQELREKLRVAQLQCSKWEELSGSRLMEAEAARSREQRRVDDIRRIQAEHAAEMRLKDEELSRLRFRVRAAANHTGEPWDSKDNQRKNDAAVPGQSELYHTLVRTEELQRNAFEQQQMWMMQASQEQQQLQPQSGRAPWNLQSTMSNPPHTPAQTEAGVTVGVAPVAYNCAKSFITVNRPLTRTDSISKKKESVLASGATPTTQPADPVGGLRNNVASMSGLPDSGNAQESRFPHTPFPSQNPEKALSARSATHESPEKSRSDNALPSEALAEKRTSSKDSSTLTQSLTSASAISESSRQGNAKVVEELGPTKAQNEVAAAEELGKQTAQFRQILEEEEGVRKEIEVDEESTRKGIEWSQKSQRAVVDAQVLERRKAQSTDYGEGEARSIGFGMSQFPSQQQHFVPENLSFETESDRDDFVLQNKSDSTDSSF